jgi:RNA polymerase subunit RPABC4/transcription elongation factor Spt4
MIMDTKPSPKCGVHKTTKEWRQTTFVYEEDGITVSVPGIEAWVCPVDGEASFTPQTTDDLLMTVRELLESARRAKIRRSKLTEYIVSVSSDQQLRPAA